MSVPTQTPVIYPSQLYGHWPTEFDVVAKKSCPGITLAGTEALGVTCDTREIAGKLWITTNAIYSPALNGFVQPDQSRPSSAAVLTPSGLAGPVVSCFASAGCSGVIVWNMNMPLGLWGNGITDDTAGINNALAAGGRIQMPPGNFLIFGTMLMPSNTSLIGDTRNTTILTCANGFTGVQVKYGFPGPSVTMIANSQIANASLTPVQENIQVKDIQLNGHADVIQANFNNPGAGIFFRQVANVELDAVDMYNMPNTGVQIEGNGNSQSWPVANNMSLRMTRMRLNLTLNPNGAQPNYVDPTNTVINFLIRGVNGILFDANVIGDLLYDNNSLQLKDGIDFDGCSYVQATNNRIYYVGDGISFNVGGYYIVKGNLIDGANGFGISLYSTNGDPVTGPGDYLAVVSDNVISNIGAHTATATSPGKGGIITSSPNGTDTKESFSILIHHNNIQFAPTAVGPSGIVVAASNTSATDNLIDCGNCPNVIKGVRISTGSGGLKNVQLKNNQVVNAYTGVVTGYEVDFNNSNPADRIDIQGNTAGVSVAVPFQAAGGTLQQFTNSRIKNNSWNPVGVLIVHSTPAGTLPASGTLFTTTFPYDCDLYIFGVTVTDVVINGQSTGISGGPSQCVPVSVPANATVAVTYTGSGGTFTLYAN